MKSFRLFQGNTATHVGIVVGAYQLVMFLSSPYFGLALSQRTFAPRFLLWAGLVVDGMSSVAFGFVVFARNPTFFFLLSLTSRVVQSLGEELQSINTTCQNSNENGEKIPRTYWARYLFQVTPLQ